MNPRFAATVAISALTGGAISAVLVLALAEGPTGPTGERGPAGGPGPRGLVGQSAVHGAYVLSDSSTCPAGTTLANAEVSVGTNSTTGLSLFALCYIK